MELLLSYHKPVSVTRIHNINYCLSIRKVTPPIWPTDKKNSKKIKPKKVGEIDGDYTCTPTHTTQTRACGNTDTQAFPHVCLTNYNLVHFLGIFLDHFENNYKLLHKLLTQFALCKRDENECNASLICEPL